jgi:hypothetical protein
VADLVAAAIPKGAIVARADGSEVEISRVENATPREGLITWTDKASGNRFAVPASRRVPVVSLPQ